MDNVAIPLLDKYGDLRDKTEVMLLQETTVYKCQDYLAASLERKKIPDSATVSEWGSTTSCRSTSSTSSPTTTTAGPVSETWREKICEWSFQVIDHFDFNREVVSISISYLDRFLSTVAVNKKIFQLAAMTTLYLAIKLYEPGNLRLSSLIELSRGYFMAEHVVAMEEAILRALSWRVHPPTPLCFVRHLVILIPECSASVKHEVMELSRFLTELSVCDYFFVTKRASSIAVASILNAIDVLPPRRLPSRTRSDFVTNVNQFAQIDCDSSEIREVRNRLKEIYYQGGYSHHQEDTPGDHQKGLERVESVSPVCVSGFSHGETRR